MEHFQIIRLLHYKVYFLHHCKLMSTFSLNQLLKFKIYTERNDLQTFKY